MLNSIQHLARHIFLDMTMSLFDHTKAGSQRGKYKTGKMFQNVPVLEHSKS